MYPGYESPNYDSADASSVNMYEKMIFQNAGYRLGDIKMRQMRVNEDSCEAPGRLSNAVERCYMAYNEDIEEVDLWVNGEKTYVWHGEESANSTSYYR